MSDQSTNKAVVPQKDPAVKNLDESPGQRVGRFNSRQEARKRRFSERAEEAHGEPGSANGSLELAKVPRMENKSFSQISKVIHRTGEHARNVFDLNLAGNVGFMASMNRKPLTKEEIRARSNARRLGTHISDANIAAVSNGNAALPAIQAAPQPVAGEQVARQNSGNDQDGIQAGRRADNAFGHSFGRGQVRGRGRVRGNGGDGEFERGFTSGFARGYDQGFARGLAFGSSNNQSGNGSALVNVSHESHGDSRSHQDEPEAEKEDAEKKKQADREAQMGGLIKIFD